MSNPTKDVEALGNVKRVSELVNVIWFPGLHCPLKFGGVGKAPLPNFKVKSVGTKLLVRAYEEFSLVNHVRTVSVAWFLRDYVFSKSFKSCRHFHGNVHDILS